VQRIAVSAVHISLCDEEEIRQARSLRKSPVYLSLNALNSALGDYPLTRAGIEHL
jgi:hypothetical protein